MVLCLIDRTCMDRARGAKLDLKFNPPVVPAQHDKRPSAWEFPRTRGLRQRMVLHCRKLAVTEVRPWSREGAHQHLHEAAGGA